MTPERARAALVVLGLALAAPANAEVATQYQNLLTPLLEGNRTVIDQEITYPPGTPNVTAAIVTIPPGGDTGWHTHPVPLFVYILEGAVTVDYGAKGTKVYRAGESILEAMDWAHNGMNRTDAPLKILAVYMGAEGMPNTEPADTPK